MFDLVLVNKKHSLEELQTQVLYAMLINNFCNIRMVLMLWTKVLSFMFKFYVYQIGLVALLVWGCAKKEKQILHMICKWVQLSEVEWSGFEPRAFCQCSMNMCIKTDHIRDAAGAYIKNLDVLQFANFLFSLSPISDNFGRKQRWGLFILFFWQNHVLIY